MKGFLNIENSTKNHFIKGWKLQNSLTCSFCNQNIESITHLFVDGFFCQMVIYGTSGKMGKKQV